MPVLVAPPRTRSLAAVRLKTSQGSSHHALPTQTTSCAGRGPDPLGIEKIT